MTLNGGVVARFLEGHSKVESGILSRAGVASAEGARGPMQQRGFGSMLSMELGSLDRVNDFVRGLKVCLLAESLGGVETLICHPATMTHAAVGAEGRRRLGITDGLVRVSVGIEDVEDLVADLGAALDGIG